MNASNEDFLKTGRCYAPRHPRCRSYWRSLLPAGRTATTFQAGEVLTRKDSNLQHKNQNLVCYHYTTDQDKGRDGSLILSPLGRVCLLRSGARYGGSLRCCLGDNLFGLTTRLAGVWAYTFLEAKLRSPSAGDIGAGVPFDTNGILRGESTAHSISPQRPLPAILEGTPGFGKETNSKLAWKRSVPSFQIV